MNRDNIADLRQQYGLRDLEQSDLLADPIKQFELWFNQAREMGVPEPNAMTLATVDDTGQPAARTVLLKGLDQRGFIFYTNYNSQKGQEMLGNPSVALSFLWLQAERQVRVQGQVEKLNEEESTKYFQSRPRGSQLGAWASPQSSIIPNRETLEKNLTELERKYANQSTIPRPAHWGGYLIRPDVIEFWQGRPSRLHDRFVYKRSDGDNWTIERLAP